MCSHLSVASLYILSGTNLEMMGVDSHILPVSLWKFNVQLSLFLVRGNFFLNCKDISFNLENIYQITVTY